MQVPENTPFHLKLAFEHQDPSAIDPLIEQLDIGMPLSLDAQIAVLKVIRQVMRSTSGTKDSGPMQRHELLLARKQMRIGQAEMARLIKRSRNMLSQYENGHKPIPEQVAEAVRDMLGRHKQADQ